MWNVYQRSFLDSSISFFLRLVDKQVLSEVPRRPRRPLGVPDVVSLGPRRSQGPDLRTNRRNDRCPTSPRVMPDIAERVEVMSVLSDFRSPTVYFVVTACVNNPNNFNVKSCAYIARMWLSLPSSFAADPKCCHVIHSSCSEAEEQDYLHLTAKPSNP